MLEPHVNTYAPPSIKQVRKCSHEGCTKPHYGLGYCRSHWVKNNTVYKKSQSRDEIRLARNFKARQRRKKPEVRFKDAIRFATKERGLEFNLTFTTWWTFVEFGCIYCHKSLVDSVGISLDRIDNSKGYVLPNVVPCCGDCNKMRNDYVSYPEFCVMMQALLDHRKAKNVT